MQRPFGRTQRPHPRSNSSASSNVTPSMEQREQDRVQVRTSRALIVMPRKGWVEQRWDADAQFTPEAVAENQAVIDALVGADAHVLLYVLPAAMEVHQELMNRDHFREVRTVIPLQAVAVVTDSEQMRLAAKVYFLYHTQAFPVQVFDEEADAQAWLEGHWRALAR